MSKKNRAALEAWQQDERELEQIRKDARIVSACTIDLRPDNMTEGELRKRLRAIGSIHSMHILFDNLDES